MEYAKATGFEGYSAPHVQLVLERIGNEPLYSLVVTVGRPWEHYMSFAVPRELALGENGKPATDLWELLRGVERKDPLLLGNHPYKYMADAYCAGQAHYIEKIRQARENNKYATKKHNSINEFSQRLQEEMFGKVIPHVFGHDGQWHECFAGDTHFADAGTDILDAGRMLVAMVVKRK